MVDQVSRMPTKADFASAVGSAFSVCVSGGDAFEMQLLSLADSSSDVQETYSLEFLAPPDVEPRQGTFRLTHETIGEAEIFLVPIKKDVTGLYFEAIFNRFLDPLN
ncbi:MAG: hypothetical protein QM785_04450 [Pyrinomonadaceae bacterium]